MKLVFEMQRAFTTNVWAEPFVKLRLPHIFHLRRDRFERADFNSDVYWRWVIHHAPYLYVAQAVVKEQIDTQVSTTPEGSIVQP